MRPAPNFMKYNAFCARAEIQDEAYEDHPICHEAKIVSNDKYKDDSDSEPEEPVSRTVPFDLDGPSKYSQSTSDNTAKAYVPTKPGKVVSVNQMISSTPGLIAQISSNPYKARYQCATVFIDHASDYSYVVIQKSTSAQETVEAKMIFEHFASDKGIKIQSYHCYNGVFRSNLWKEHCMNQGQGLSFAGVNAHHQNGRAEQRIQELQQLARTSIIHASQQWPEAITPNLWPYAVQTSK